MKKFFVISCLFPLFAHAQIQISFEDSLSDDWLQYPPSRWQISDDEPINGNYSLHHIYNNSEADRDRISIALPTNTLQPEKITWRFLIRYGYNPSGSNNWSVFLASQKDATTMFPNSYENAFILGVNFTGTDDIIKLWKSGLYQSISITIMEIANTDFNWQESVGKDSIAAIEVSYESDGNWTIQIGIGGNFNLLQQIGSCNEKMDFTPEYFGICYSYTKSADQLLWIDDLSIEMEYDNPNNGDSYFAKGQMDEPYHISSTLSTEKDRISLMEIKFTDMASGDGFPTLISRLTFEQSGMNDFPDWQTIINGAVLTDNDSIYITGTVQNDAIVFDCDSGITIPDGQSIFLYPEIWLNTRLPENADNQQLGIKLDYSLIKTDETGSFFSSGSCESSEQALFISVDATELMIYDVPDFVSKGSLFGISVAAVDSNTNVDLDAENNIVLSCDEYLSSESGFWASLSEGKYSWNDLKYIGNQEFSIQISDASTQLSGCSSQLIYVINDTTSIITSPTSQTTGGTISSLANSRGKAVEVFRFIVSDESSGDELPMTITYLTIKNANPENSADWTNTIAGIILNDSINEISTGNEIITDETITIPITSDELTLNDGEMKELVCSIYLNTEKIEDNSALQFMISSTNHDCTTDSSGSVFLSEFPADIVSGFFRVNVIATQLLIAECPSNVGLNTDFTIEVEAADANKNTDTDASDTLILAKEYGEGELISENINISLEDGIATWENIILCKAGKYVLSVSGTKFQTILSSEIYVSDANSTVEASSNQDFPDTIYSTCIDSDSIFPVFSCKIADNGISDSLPTVIRQIVLKNTTPENSANWITTISDLQIFEGNTSVEINSLEISEDEITIEFPQNVLEIADADSLEITFAITLNKFGITDKSLLQFIIEANDHDWTTYDNSSLLSDEFESDIISRQFLVEVEATCLKFSDFPSIVQKNAMFELKIAACDENANIDTDCSVTLNFHKTRGKGTLSVKNNSSFLLSKGSCIIDSIYYDGENEFCLNADCSSGELNTASSITLFSTTSPDTMISDNFENDFSKTWRNTADWTISEYQPVTGMSSLKHNVFSEIGESFIYCCIPKNELNSGIVEWKFNIKTGDWTPTTSNNFIVWLIAEKNDTTPPNDGIALTVNTSDNTLALQGFKNGIVEKTIIETDFQWKANTAACLKVSAKQSGKWSMKISIDNDFSHFVLLSEENEDADFSYENPVLGIEFYYTSTRAGQLWIDDISIIYANTPPMIKNVKALNSQTIHVEFTEQPDETCAEDISNYILTNSSGNILPVSNSIVDSSNPESVFLTVTDLETNKYLLETEGICDKNSLSGIDSVEFYYPEPTENILINEIMPDPEPSVYLPEAEYIELYNNSLADVNISGWSVVIGNSSRDIDSATIAANSYTIVCDKGDSVYFTEYGDVIAIENLPSFSNSEQFVAFLNNESEIISWINYTDDWFSDEYKADGGWSLECIDPLNKCGGQSNWCASEDSEGGTPGRVNSVAADNPDSDVVELKRISVVSDSIIRLHFNEPLNAGSVENPLFYSVDNQTGNPSSVEMLSPEQQSVLLYFSTPFSKNIIYTLSIEGTIEDCAGNTIDSYNTAKFALPETTDSLDIIINELLFNPLPGGSDFVELYNRSNKTIDLNDLYIASGNSETGQIESVTQLSESGYLLFPCNFMAFTTDADFLSDYYFTINTDAILETSSIPTYDDSEGTVVITDKSLNTIDRFKYNSDMQFGLLTEQDGVSLERINYEQPTNDRNNWHSAAEDAGFATPGTENSQYMETESGIEENLITIEPEVFSPDNDGYEDFTTISYAFDEPGYIANICIFNAKGKLIRQLANNLLLSTNGFLNWDGIKSNGNTASIGIYIVYVEILNLQGDIQRFKKPCVVACKFD